jgi:hypothetical protein
LEENMDQSTRLLEDGGRHSDLVNGEPGHSANEGMFS